ncbi:MAG: hypothetical protein ACE5GB_09510 [Acidimicrobiales bacterium]
MAIVLASAVGDTHEWFAWVVIGSNAVAGLWALGAHRLERLRGRGLWAFTAIAQLTIFVQAGLGSWLMVREDLEPPRLHALYGFSSLAFVGMIYSYRQQLAEHRYLLYAGGGLFLMGMGLRAVFLDTAARF